MKLMCARVSTIVLTLVLVAVILTLTPLANVDPPDPTWISGIWDDDDFDDVVGYVTSAAGLLPNPVACDLRPVALPVLLSPLGSRAVVSVPRSASSPRAPPPDVLVQSPPLSLRCLFSTGESKER